MQSRLLLLLLLALAEDVIAQTCSSKVYCKSPEVRYMGMNQASEVYLNATAIKSTSTRNISSCQTLCLRENGCFSININISKANEYGCHLLAENMYTNSSLLVENKDFIHLFVETPCKKKPCKYDGICSPNYNNDTYSCKCMRNATFISSGKDCQTVSSGFRSADYYWSFDKTVSSSYFKAKSGTGIDVSSFKFQASSKVNVISVPDRRRRVAYLETNTSAVLQLHGLSIPCLNTFSGCQDGVSYSVWIRMPERETKQNVNQHDLFYSHMTGSNSGLHFIGYGNEAAGYSLTIIPSSNTKWTVSGFGGDVRRTLWNHFMFTLGKDGPLCAFINGIQVKCSSTGKSISTVTTNTKVFRFGHMYDGSRRNEMFVDEFAVWKSTLTPEDVKAVYRKGKL